MKVISIKPAQNGKNLSGSKELKYAYSLVGLKSGSLVEVATVRMWKSRRSDDGGKLYCTVWAGNTLSRTAGHGFASGYGYHKRSAALSSALRSAGIELDKDIHGGGDAAVEDALIALGVKLGYRAKALSVFAHG